MPTTNQRKQIRVGPGDVYNLDPNASYEVSTVGFDGGSSDVIVHVADNDLASPADTSLATNWTVLRDTGASGEASNLAVTAGSKKLMADVQDPLVDGGVVITVKSLDVLTQDDGMNGMNNQRQKDSSARRRTF